MKWQSNYIFNKISIGFYIGNKNKLIGRFGDGWNWKFGFRISENIIVFSLLIMEIVIFILKNNKKSNYE